MLQVFTKLADWAVALMGLDSTTKLGTSVHFFIEDIVKIFVLIYVLIFVISLFRSQLSADKIRTYLSGKNRWYGYLLAVFLGVVTPFCSCSSIPLFIGFLVAGIPFGITMAFLISSPLISEIATVMLVGMKGAGPLVALVYVLVGTVIAVIGGYLVDLLHLEKYLDFVPTEPSRKGNCSCGCGCGCKKSRTQKLVNLLKYAHYFAWDTLKSIALYVLLGLIVGAAIHGYVPVEFFGKYLGSSNPFAVPLATVIGAPIYANHVGVVPIVQALLLKGVPVGTALVILMSITAISLPEIMMLKKVLSWKLIGLFLGYLIIAFIAVGYLLNWIL